MSLLLAMMVGVLIGMGWSFVQHSREITVSMLVGVVGAVIGASLVTLIGDQSYMLFSWPGLFWSFVGATLALTIFYLFDYIPDKTSR